MPLSLRFCEKNFRLHSLSPLFKTLCFILLSLLCLSCQGDSFERPQKKEETPKESPVQKEEAGWVRLSSGLRYKDTKVGSGRELKDKEGALVHYLGYLPDGKKFDSSYDRGTPFPLDNRVGNSGGWSVIEGWKQGIPGMREGGKRTLKIPPELGYGASGQGSIPPHATLIFEVELVKVRK
jgi:FKBP-type peptidyl-prolyl cis-trans isomerase